MDESFRKSSSKIIPTTPEPVIIRTSPRFLNPLIYIFTRVFIYNAVTGEQVVLNANLAKGTYIVIPSTYDSNQEGEFILRVLYDKENNIEIRCVNKLFTTM